MPRVGGKRPGAGRKPGSANKLTREIADNSFKKGITPLEYMLQVLRDPRADTARRDQMAIAAAPYIHPRLQPITNAAESEKLVVEIVQFTPKPEPLPAPVGMLKAPNSER